MRLGQPPGTDACGTPYFRLRPRPLSHPSPTLPTPYPTHLQHHCGGAACGGAGRITEHDIPRKEAKEEDQDEQAPGGCLESEAKVMKKEKERGEWQSVHAAKEGHSKLWSRRESLG